MLTIISFFLTILGGINWLMIGLLQYDFVAGIFGFQASIFSRIIYIIIGAAGAFLVFKLIKGKGTLPIWTKRNKKDLSKTIEKITHKSEPKFSQNVEGGEELDLSRYNENDLNSIDTPHPQGLFDEHFDETRR
ncbi:MAG: DUF378 domain-containing protein [Clostridiales bacterium]|nr:DUF378 domain-containing protein [Clostridiales bacterium]